jgi:hypothetical protein
MVGQKVTCHIRDARCVRRYVLPIIEFRQTLERSRESKLRASLSKRTSVLEDFNSGGSAMAGRVRVCEEKGKQRTSQSSFKVIVSKSTESKPVRLMLESQSTVSSRVQINQTPKCVL